MAAGCRGVVVSTVAAAVAAGVKAADDTMRRAAGRTARTCIYVYIERESARERCVYGEKGMREEKKESK